MTFLKLILKQLNYKGKGARDKGKREQ